jgi:hypothetical protein
MAAQADPLSDSGDDVACDSVDSENGAVILGVAAFLRKRWVINCLY